MPELPDVVPGEAVNSTTFGNPVVRRVLSRYTDATERDFKVPTPTVGDFAYLTASNELQVYDGATWITYEPSYTPVGGIDWQPAQVQLLQGVKTLINTVTAPDVEGIYIASWSSELRAFNVSPGFHVFMSIEQDSVEIESWIIGGFEDVTYTLSATWRAPSIGPAANSVFTFYAESSDVAQGFRISKAMADVRWIG